MLNCLSLQKTVYYVRLGSIGYKKAMELQERISSRKEIDKDVLLLLEHPPTFTSGRQGKGFLNREGNRLRSFGAECFDVDRGGLETFHGPGQLVGYPILDLRRHGNRMRWYIEKLEEVLIRTCHELGINKTGRSNVGMGVWINNKKKIGSIGVQNTNWITKHGFSLNVDVDERWFSLINPCGLGHLGVSSIKKELALINRKCPTMKDIIPKIVFNFGSVFNCKMVEKTLENLFRDPLS